MVENLTNLINHSYGIVLDIIKCHIYDKSQKRKTKIMNIYDNKLSKKQI